MNVSTPVIESIEKNKKSLLLIDVMGIDKNDINIKVEPTIGHNQTIKINGNTKNEMFDKNFEISVSITVGKPMEELSWDVKNGFLTLDIKFQEPVKPIVKVIRK